MNSKNLTVSALAVALGLGATSAAFAGDNCCAPSVAQTSAQVATSAWESILPVEEIASLINQPGVVLLDARSAGAYAAGHLPGAVNVPGADWRTGSAKPGEGDSQYIFRNEAGSPDIARYERLLSEAGIANDDTVVVYGNHAGKTDGSIPAMLLDWLGHDRVVFLDGVALTDWQAAGYDIETAPHTLPATDYRADPTPGFVWNLDDVLDHLGDEDVVFVDTRSREEYEGDPATLEKRGNARGGCLPGAVLLDYADQLDEAKHTRTPAEVAEQLAAAGVEKDNTVVLYCQTATRVSLPYLLLRDLGYEKVFIYDASWHEYGNRDDTPIEGPARRGELSSASTSTKD